MSDQIQDDLEAWWSQGDRDRGGLALDAVARAWRPIVRAWLQGGAPDEVEEVLARAIHVLCLFAPGERPRALAPAGAESPRAWRRTVLKNHLASDARYRSRRGHAETAVAHGLSPAVEQAEWRKRQEERRRGASGRGRGHVANDSTVPFLAVLPEQESLGDLGELGMRRHLVVRLLPRLAIRRRVVLIQALGGDPSAHARELAQELGDHTEAVLGRIAASHALPPTPGTENLSLEQVRVTWPVEPVPLARESARRALARAVEDLQKLLGGDS